MVKSIIMLSYQLGILLLPLVFTGCGLFMVDPTPKKPPIPLNELIGIIVFSSDRVLPTNSIINNAYGLYSINPSGCELKRLSPPYMDSISGTWNISEDCPSLSSDGKNILFIRYFSKEKWTTEIWAMNIDGTDRRCFIGSNIENVNYTRLGFSVSPDGQNILVSAYSKEEKDNSSLSVIKNIFTGPIIEKLQNKGMFSADWSPDGKKIVFQSLSDKNARPEDLNNEIFLINSDGTNLINISNNLSRDADPAWSPDGKKIAFISSRNRNNHVYVMDPDGSKVQQITTGRFNCNSPVWSPDGKYIAYCRSTTSPLSGHEIWVTTADGTMERQLTKRVKFKYSYSTDQHPDWK